ncbi:MAG: hypothetical protein JWO69_2043 [Thermoleophilia bacterium]|nr:hypothetical protein [Thermoleophilia bacterium]
MTPDTCGPESSEPFACFDPDTSSWRTSKTTSLWALTLSSVTWPRRGSMRSGACFARPTWEPPTAAPACSWLLPTPAASFMRQRNIEGWRERFARNPHLPAPNVSLGLALVTMQTKAQLTADALRRRGASTSPLSDGGSESSAAPLLTLF